MTELAAHLSELAGIDAPAGQTMATAAWLKPYGQVRCDGAGNVTMLAAEGKIKVALAGRLDEPTAVAHGGGRDQRGFAWLGDAPPVSDLLAKRLRAGSQTFTVEGAAQMTVDQLVLGGPLPTPGMRLVYDAPPAQVVAHELVGKALSARLGLALFGSLYDRQRAPRGFFLTEGGFHQDVLEQALTAAPAAFTLVPLGVKTPIEGVGVVAACRNLRLRTDLRDVAMAAGANPVVLDDQLPLVSAIRQTGSWPIPLVVHVPYLGLEREKIAMSALQTLLDVALDLVSRLSKEER